MTTSKLLAYIYQLISSFLIWKILITYQLAACLQLKNLTWKFQLDQVQPKSMEPWVRCEISTQKAISFTADFQSKTESARPKRKHITGPLWETPWEKITSKWNVWIFCKFPLSNKTYDELLFFTKIKRERPPYKIFVKLPLNSHNGGHAYKSCAASSYL